MKRSLVATALVLFGATQLEAQSACPGGAPTSREQITQDACQKAVDLFNYMAPQLGTAIAGGNATLGQGGTLGGIGHFTVSIRANAVQGSLPKVEDVTPSPAGATASTYETSTQVIALPAVDAAIGVFGGLPLGLTKVGGVDLLLSAAYLPEFEGNEVSVATPEGGLKVGYGARVGLLQESLVVPGLSVTYMKRDLPVTNVSAATTGAELAVRGLSLETSSWRVVASKSLMMFGIALGAGQDSYKSSAIVQGDLAGAQSDEIALDQDLTRTNYFADVSLNLLMAKFVGEIGLVSGGDVATFNQFNGKAADDSRIYGSIGFRIGL